MSKNMKSEGYKYIGFIGHGQHILLDTNTNECEVWFSNKNHAGYRLIYKNTHLEFAHSASDREKFEAVI